MSGIPPIEDFMDEQDEARFAENRKIQRKLNAVQANYTEASQRAARLGRELDALDKILNEGRALAPQPDWLKARRRKEKPGQATLIAMLSDVHGGERVEATEMQYYNSYDLRICELRLKRYFENVLKLATDFVGGVTFDGIVLPLGGDQVSGTIHDELSETNELSTFETILWLAPRLVTGLEMWAEYFKNVHVVSTPGNHPRDSRIPRYKGRSAHNADTLLSKMLAYYWSARNPEANVTFSIPDAFDTNFEVYEYNFSLEHGDNMKFSGTSEIGALGPVKRGTLRKARQQQEEGRTMHYNLLGHFHQYIPAASQGFVMNGSLVGYNEYARGWHFTPERPQQALMVVTPEYGITSTHPVFVSKREEEGW